MRTLALDPKTWDLDILDGRLSLVDGARAKAQRLHGRLALWRGEYPLDLDVGVPYGRLLGERGTAERLAQTVRAAAQTSPGVLAVEQFSASVGADRVAEIMLAAIGDEGEPIDLGPLRIE